MLAKDSEGTVELRAMEFDPDAGGTSQRDDDIWTPQDTIEPPENLPALSRLTSASQIRSVCIGALARNTVGLGWDVGVWPEHEGPADKEAIRECRHQLDALARRDTRLERPSFSDLMYAVEHDLEEFGNGSLEASRNKRTGKIDGLYHLPGQLVRRKKKRDGWVMGQNPELVTGDATRVDYYNFGEKVLYDDAGKPRNRLQTPRLGWARNEVIHFRIYTSESRDYGLPRDADMAIEYAAFKFVTEWTQSFFSGSATPPTVLFVQGQEQKDGSRVRFRVDASVMRRIQQAIKTDARAGQRVVVVPVPPGTTIRAEKLSEMSDRDITFKDFREEHRHSSGDAFGLMPIFYGNVGDGRYTAEVQRAFTLEETFDPHQRYLEDRLWPLLSDLDYSEHRLVFKRLAVESDSARRESAQNGAEIGVITVGEWRKINGFDPLPTDLEPDDPENPNNQLIKAKVAAPAHDEVDIDEQDGRGKRPGIGGRPGPRDEPVAKTDPHEGEPHVEEAVDELADELSEYGPVERDG